MKLDVCLFHFFLIFSCQHLSTYSSIHEILYYFNYFELQRSSDGTRFNTITTVLAAGNSQTQKKFFVTDKLPIEGNNFYRLKMIDKDGKSTYSNIQEFKFLKVNSTFTISPNPTKDFINIISSNDIKDEQVKITDLNGKTLYSAKQIFTAGQQYKISIAQFSKQVLIITIQSNNEKEQFKVVKE
ncbi:MAG: T9SS type A sorting domain-containing protein [Bacteroidota bacterium]|nr:T9SS type A sorting domain-containing protein [Bacteroidota bacterium]